MPLPTEFKVAGVTYTVEESDQIIIDNKIGYVGSCDYHETNIEILSSLSESRKNDVLIHELMHAILCEAGFDEQDEELVDRSARVLHQVLKDNDFSFLKS